jgi:hypothetical protein
MMRGKFLMGMGLSVLLAILSAGCISNGRHDFRADCGVTSAATLAQLAEARDAQTKYRELFQRAATVDEAKAAEVEVARLDKQIQELEQRAAMERRGRSEPRTIIYGPVGFVLNATEWILQKLYILDVR